MYLETYKELLPYLIEFIIPALNSISIFILHTFAAIFLAGYFSPSQSHSHDQGSCSRESSLSAMSALILI